jgi:hypothetical protein
LFLNLSDRDRDPKSKFRELDSDARDRDLDTNAHYSWASCWRVGLCVEIDGYGTDSTVEKIIRDNLGRQRVVHQNGTQGSPSLFNE